MAEVLVAVEQSRDNAAVIARTMSIWATRRNFRMTGGAGPSYPSFTVRADGWRVICTRPRGVVSLYADSHGSGPALEVRVNEMCLVPPYDRQQARQCLTADLYALGIPRFDREDALCGERPEIPLAGLAHGRVEHLLGLIDGWLGEVRARAGVR